MSEIENVAFNSCIYKKDISYIETIVEKELVDITKCDYNIQCNLDTNKLIVNVAPTREIENISLDFKII